MGAKIIDLVNTYSAYKIIFNKNLTFAEQLIQKLEETRCFYEDHYLYLLSCKLYATSQNKSIKENQKVAKDLFENVSPAYKQKCNELIAIINLFCTGAQQNLLGKLFESKLE
jgi:hypothetical protein